MYRNNDRRARYQMQAEIDHYEALRADRIAQLEKIKSDYLNSPQSYPNAASTLGRRIGGCYKIERLV